MEDETKPPELPPEYSPDEYRIAKNGAIMSRKTNKIVTGKHVNNKITGEIAAEYHAIREKNKLAGLLATNARLAKEAGTSDAAWAEVAGSMYQTATSDKGSIASVQSAKLLGEMAGFLDSRGNGREAGGPPPGGARLDVSAQGLEVLRDILTTNRHKAHNEPAGPTAGEVVDSEARDIEE